MPEARRVLFRGFSVAQPINRLRAGWVALAVNVRALLRGAFGMRSVLSEPILTLSAAVVTVARLNDTTPNGPSNGYSLLAVDAAGNLWIWNADIGLVNIATGLTGNPVSMIPFRPNTSVQSWMYIFDSAADGDVTITTKFALDGTPTTFVCGGSLKVRSDGLIEKTGIKEPQVAPEVSTSGTTTTGTDSLPANTVPWTNYSGANSTYNYSQTTQPGTGGVGAPVIISLPPGSQSLQLAVTGTAMVNGNSHAPGDTGPSTSTYPAHYTGAGPTIVLGAFTDGSGNVLTGTSPVPLLANVGAGVALQVPAGATRFQIGIDSTDAGFASNSGGPFSVAWTLITSAIAPTISTLGNATAYIWGDSPHSGPVASYIWKNPNDTGAGIPRTMSSPGVLTATNNSWEFDSSPENGTVPVQWNTLDSSGDIVGSIPLFDPALESEGYQDFNACIVGSIFVPTAGTYQFTFANKDQIMVGIGGGATVSGGYTTGALGQTMSVISGLPLVYVSTPDGGGGNIFQTVSITFPGAGSYQVEIDWDYWYHTGRALYMLLGSFASLPAPPTGAIPPLPSGVRTNVSYAITFRSSLTGATSNPSPTSPPQLTPVLDNTVTPTYSPDPQVDKVDYWRQDSGLTNFTYVGTGPNTNPVTPIVDSLADTDAASNRTLEDDNFEPVPSIDLPRSGTCTVSGGVIAQTGGDSFNVRWLAGTVIEIGAPTPYGQAVIPQGAYSLIARPTSTATMYIPGVPDGTDLVWNIAEPILAAQPLAYAFGPTDNVNFAYAVGDPLRPGTNYWCKGSNLDSWPDTNQQDVTDPSEALVNGAMSSGLAVLASIKRVWIVMPNFFGAVATSTGTEGSTWTNQATTIPRGLYMPRCLYVEGGGTAFFRVKDGILASKSGLGAVSITDDELYPIFPHEGSTPQPITRNGVTIYPPDDSQPQSQQFSGDGQYLYYDYAYRAGEVPVQMSTPFTLCSVSSEGLGIPWIDPSDATAGGIGSNQTAIITEFSISGSVVTFSTATQTDPLVAGQPVTISDLSVGTYLNGEVLTVSASGLSDTGFEAAFSHVNVSATLDYGLATPSTAYTFAVNPAGYAPPVGQYTAWSIPGWVGYDQHQGTCFGGTFAPWKDYAGPAYSGGVNGCPFGTGTGALSTSAPCPTPTLPVGAVVQSIIPTGIAIQTGAVYGGAFLYANNPAPGYPYTLGGSTSIHAPNLGTDLSVLASTTFSMEARSTLEESPPSVRYPYTCDAVFYGVAVNYTLSGGSPVSSTQLQTLVATPCGIDIPSDSPATGIEVNFQAGMQYGSAANLIVQLTLNGVLVGNPKGITAGPWATYYSLGGDGDDWGIAGLTGAQVNGIDGLGVNIWGTLPVGAQVNLNELSGKVFYTASGTVEGSATLVFDIEAKGWILDVPTPAITIHASSDGQSQQGVLAGCADGTIRTLGVTGLDYAVETPTAAVVTGAIGGQGYQHCSGFTIEYSSETELTLTPTAVDEGNESYAPQPVTLPATGGQITKYRGWFSPNKWKLLQFALTFTDPSAFVFIEGAEVDVRDWGSDAAYRKVAMFGEAGGFGGQS